MVLEEKLVEIRRSTFTSITTTVMEREVSDENNDDDHHNRYTTQYQLPQSARGLLEHGTPSLEVGSSGKYFLNSQSKF